MLAQGGLELTKQPSPAQTFSSPPVSASKVPPQEEADSVPAPEGGRDASKGNVNILTEDRKPESEHTGFGPALVSGPRAEEVISGK